jgi:peptide-methionine (S)-S-oxide reductase
MIRQGLIRTLNRPKPERIALFQLTVLFFGLQTFISGDLRMKSHEKATFGAGCFWCVEAIYQRIDGVVDIEVGYAGGTVPHPTYEQVCTGTTGHAETAQITFDARKVTYEEILEVFWRAHDPTTLNRQGNDIGTQYRSAIFYHDSEQKVKAEKSKAEQSKSGKYGDKIVTKIVSLTEFYEAENYHQDYFENNPEASYCRLAIEPKLKKLKLK